MFVMSVYIPCIYKTKLKYRQETKNSSKYTSIANINPNTCIHNLKKLYHLKYFFDLQIG